MDKIKVLKEAVAELVSVENGLLHDRLMAGMAGYAPEPQIVQATSKMAQHKTGLTIQLKPE